ncbi:MAG TPA: diguanylate cyclase, partial [Gammaproteobacteria bacterium]|nr:diguanylate cyclase [Gammaproteobacteria bacterium]
YSSLDYITKFPIDTLKIDKSFVSDMEENPAHDSIVKATIALAHALKLKFVAEGIETKGQLDRLVELGCDEAQGYFFSEPLPADRFLQWACNYQCEAKTGKVIVSKSS